MDGQAPTVHLVQQVAATWRREKKIKAKKRTPVGQGIPLQPITHASEGMMQALNGTMPRPHHETVSRKQLTKMLAQASPESSDASFTECAVQWCMCGVWHLLAIGGA